MRRGQTLRDTKCVGWGAGLPILSADVSMCRSVVRGRPSDDGQEACSGVGMHAKSKKRQRNQGGDIKALGYH